MRDLILDDGEYSLCCLISVVEVNGLVVLAILLLISALCGALMEMV